MSCWCDGDDPGCTECQPLMTDEQRASARATKTMRDAGPDLVQALLRVEYVHSTTAEDDQCPVCGGLRPKRYEPRRGHISGICSTYDALKKAGVPTVKSDDPTPNYDE